MRTRSTFIAGAFAGLVFLAGFPGGANAGYQASFAECTGTQQITFSWEWYEFESYTSQRPEWVGYDVLRRPLGSCAPFQRINAVSLPRVFGQSHSNAYVDTPPTQFETYEYQAIPVDANRERVSLSFPDCESPCVKPAWASCPANSAPLVIGTVVDWGWAIYIQPCPSSCQFGFHTNGGPIEQELRDQGRVGTVVKMYGEGWCCGVEGAIMSAVAWEPGNCGITPTRRPSWGELKTIYR